MTTSVNTNLAALVALRTLNTVSTALNSTEKRVSTGYTVADGFDNGAIFAIAQSVRNSIAGITAVNSELKGSQGLVSVANAARRLASSGDSSEKMGIAVSRAGSMAQVLSLKGGFGATLTGRAAPLTAATRPSHQDSD